MPRRRAGTVFYLERIALPPTAELHVALFDVADPEQPEQIVAELTELLGDRQAAIPVVVSFTVETDGRLPSGQSLGEAIEEVDAQTEGAAAYFMVNCAHPTHFADVLEDDGGRVERIRGVRANASAKSHEELDQSDELDEGSPAELAEQYVDLTTRLRNLNVVGGCCGTDHRHIAAICTALAT